MHKIAGYLRRFASSSDCRLEVDSDRLRIPVGSGARHQEIQFERQGDDYVITSVVVGRAQVIKEADRRRELARLAWHRNAEHEVVTFAFDRNDRLVGQIRHPAAHLDYDEFALYVHVLAHACDRFEFLLSGSDLF